MKLISVALGVVPETSRSPPSHICPPLKLPNDATAAQVEAHLDRLPRHPVALLGIVENVLVRPLDPAVKLPEHSRVIIVASEKT